MKREKSITYKITSLLLALSLLSLFITGLVSAGSLYSMKNISEENGRELGESAAAYTEQALEKSAGEQLKSTASGKAAYIEGQFDTVMGYVHGIASQAEAIYENPDSYPDREVAPPVKGSHELAAQLLHATELVEPSLEQRREILKLGNLQELLLQYNANNDMVSSDYVATVSGWVIMADYIADNKFSKDSDTPNPFDAAERQWFQRALAAGRGETVYSDVLSDIHDGGDCIVCAQPIYRDGEIVAVAGVGFYLKAINDAVLNTTIGESGYAFLVNGKGQVMVSPRAEGETAADSRENRDLRLSDNEALAAAVEKVLKGESGVKKMLLDGKWVYLAYAPLPDLEWGFLTVMDVEEVIAPAVEGEKEILSLSGSFANQLNDAIRRMLLSFAAILALTAAAVGAAGMLFGKKITAPVRRLTDDVKKLGNDNLDYRITIATGDEVEELGNAFNAMTEKLRNYIGNLAAVTAEKEKIRTELAVAAAIQQDMLPDAGIFEACPEFTLRASMTPAKEVGGDFYDFFLLDADHLAIVVADVSGKGVPAALFMVIAKNQLRFCMASEDSLEKAMERANENLCENNKNNMFVTVWAGVLTLSDGTLTYVNAGHCRPLVRQQNQEFTYLASNGGFVLAGIPGMKYEQSVISLSPGDVLFQYTDGVTEANDPVGRLYGEDRLKRLLDGEVKEPEQILPAVWRDIRSFQGDALQFDDITMLSVCYHGKAEEDSVTGPADSNRMGEVADFVERKLGDAGFPKKETAKILVAVDEVFSNICYYSGALEVEVACRVCAGKAEICFSDNGIPYNPLQKPDPDVSGDVGERVIGGLGIYIVKKTMDEVAYEYCRKEGKNRLLMVKKAVVFMNEEG